MSNITRKANLIFSNMCFRNLDVLIRSLGRWKTAANLHRCTEINVHDPYNIQIHPL